MIKINVREYGIEFIYDLIINLLKNPFVLSADLNKNITEIVVKHIDKEIALRKDINYLILTKNVCQN